MPAEGWREALAVHGHAVVRGVALDADNQALRALASALGAAAGGSATRPNQPQEEAHGIARVEAMDAPQSDPAGRPILSTTADDFPLHTDDSFSASPARFVLMHCWQADAAGGGASKLADVRAMLERLGPRTIGMLRQAAYPSPAGLVPVLWDHPATGEPCIRFNRRDLQSFGERYGPALSPAQVQALDEALAAAQGCAVQLSMAAGDCLVVDNLRVLHGRTAFDPASGRLLKRLRVA